MYDALGGKSNRIIGIEFGSTCQCTVPLHAQVEQLLRELIAQEEYQKGKTLPSEVELSKRLAISRSTVRQAVKKLVFEGLSNYF